MAGSVRLDADLNNQIFITKFASDGTVLWHKVWNTPESGGEGQDVTVDAGGNVYVAGVTPRPDPDLPGAFLGSDVALLRLDADGNLIWQRTVAAGEGVDSRGGVAVGPDGSIYVASGRFDERTSDLNALVLKFGPDGSLLSASRRTLRTRRVRFAEPALRTTFQSRTSCPAFLSAEAFGEGGSRTGRT